MCSTIQSISRVCGVPTRTIGRFEVPGGRIGREPLGDENVPPQASCRAVDFLARRACITIDVDVSQLPARFPMTQIRCHTVDDHSRSATPATSTTASVSALP